MAGILQFLCLVFFFLALIAHGNSQCQPIIDLKISQSETGKLVQNKPQRKVTILNDCECTQRRIILGCDGFQTVEKIDSSVLAVLPDGCHVNGDQPIYRSETFDFTYSWDTEYPFQVIDSYIYCG